MHIVVLFIRKYWLWLVPRIPAFDISVNDRLNVIKEERIYAETFESHPKKPQYAPSWIVAFAFATRLFSHSTEKELTNPTNTPEKEKLNPSRLKFALNYRLELLTVAFEQFCTTLP